MFVYLTNEPNSSSNFDSTIKRVKLKHNNIFMNILVTLSKAQLNIYIYIYINLILDHVSFVNKFLIYKIINYW